MKDTRHDTRFSAEQCSSHKDSFTAAILKCLLILLLTAPLTANSQINYCDDPLLDTMPTAYHTGTHSGLADSFYQKSWRRSILGDTSAKTRSAFLSLRELIRQEKPRKKIDSIATYQLLFEEVRTWREDLWGNSSATFRITQIDSLIQPGQLMARLHGAPHFAISSSWRAYTNNYLIVRFCKSHFGENSWGQTWTYYLKKKKLHKRK